MPGAGTVASEGMELGPVGLWTFALWSLQGEELSEALTTLEDQGYGTLWFPGGHGAMAMDNARAFLEGSSMINVATGIVSIYAGGSPAEVGAAAAQLRRDHPGRFLLGLGVSHPEAVDREEPGTYRPPIEAMGGYLDGLDAGPDAGGERVLAALGPRMLSLAAERALGAHPYFVPVDHTAVARDTLGAGKLLAPEQAVVLETDPSSAREVARGHMSTYLGLRNYTNNLRRLGFGDDDFADGGSDRLVDAIVAWGDADAIAARVKAHHDAGADHVCLQVLTSDLREVPREQWRIISETF